MIRKPWSLATFFFLLIFAPSLLPTAWAQLKPARPINVKVAVVIQDPVLPQFEGKRLHEVVKTPGRNFTWNDPFVLNDEYKTALEKISHGVVRYEVVEIIDDGRFFSRRNDNGEMISTDGMVSLLMEPDWKTLRETGTHFDYKAFVEYYGFDIKRDRNEINEVWVWSFPYGGMWESNYCGASGFWLNSEPTTGTANKNLLVVMGLNYERKMSLALESYGHRFESVMWHLYGRWDYDAPDPNNWEKYTRFNKTHPGLANIGNIHFPPNGTHDYDWVNKTPVTTCADGWAYYPDIKSDSTRTVDCTEWQCSHEGYMNWWFSHVPHFEGINQEDGHLNNWWHYVVKWEEAGEEERLKIKEERVKSWDKRIKTKDGKKEVGLLMPGGVDPVRPDLFTDDLQELKTFNFQIVEEGNINKFVARNKPDMIWYHETDSTVDIAQLAAQMSKPLINYVEQGGNLLLTLDAVRLLPYLGVESVTPEVNYTKLVDEGNGRKLGLHSFRSHPLFDGMLGGAYVYAPKEDVNVRRIGWFGDEVPDGKVVAVDWAYIFLHEGSKLITEYMLGKGKILAIGAYLHYDQPNYNRAHLERFTWNVLEYMTGKRMVSPARYWNFEPEVVIKDYRDAGEAVNGKPGSIESGKPVKWKRSDSGITLKGVAEPKNMWDIAGERMVLIGKEPGGIDEVWAHPVMALRDYQLNVKVSGSGEGVLLNTLKPAIEVRPEAFTRIYPIGGGQLTEVITVHPKDGNAVIHYEYTGMERIELEISFRSNLRFMWPYSERVTGEIRYRWDEDLNAWVIRDKSGDFATVVGMNVPVTSHSGAQDKDLLVALALHTTLEANGMADVIIGTSATGVTEAVSAYSRAWIKPDGVFSASVDYSNSLFNGKLSIAGPDPDFNTGYQWAMVGTDRFIVNTPGIGRSLVAGYATTDYGWNGAQKVNGRPGYAWYFGRDAVWSAFAVLGYGDFDRVKTILELFSRYQDISGKIYHELTTSGIAHYDAADATPLYIVLAGKYLRQSGDTAFIRKEWPAIRRAIDFCFSTDTDGDHLIENTQQGHGWEEGGGLYGTHTTQYMVSCWAEALEQAAYMAENIGENSLGESYGKEAQIVLEKLNNEFWNPDTGFFNHGLFRDGTFLEEPSVMTAIPVAWGQIRDNEKACSVVEKIASCDFTTDWGTRIVSEKATFFAPGGYHTGSVWPLFTGWASLGDYAAGNPVQGFSKMMSNLLIYKNWSLGYIEEVLHGTNYRYFGVCRHQCWSETMVLQPAIDGMLGLEPDAMCNKVLIRPDFPLDWDSVKVENIRVGEHVFSMTQVREPGKTTLDFIPTESAGQDITNESFVIFFDIRILKGDIFERMLVNGVEILTGQANNKDAILSGSSPLREGIHVEVYHSGGIGVLPLVHHPSPGDSSSGLKIIRDEIIDGKFVVTVEGLSGTAGKIRLVKSGVVQEHEFWFPESDEEYIKKELVFDY